jgi:hypothetical protein
MPGDSGVLVVTRVRSTTTSAHEAAGAAGTRRSPRPFLGGRFINASGALRREDEVAWGIVAMTVLQLNCHELKCPGCLKIESELGVREEFLGLAPKHVSGDDSKEKPRPEGDPGGAFMSGRSRAFTRRRPEHPG